MNYKKRNGKKNSQSDTLGGKNCEGHLAEGPAAGAPQSVPAAVGWAWRVWGRVSGTPAGQREAPKASEGFRAPEAARGPH